MRIKKQILTIKTCISSADFDKALNLTRDYFSWLDMNLSFQDIEDEFRNFSTMYGKAEGCFLLASLQEELIGGVAFRKLTRQICEMKRLFVFEKYQGKGIGEILCRELIKIASSRKYQKMRLDTVGKLYKANRLYEKLGFKDIEAYRENPEPSARFMEIDLRSATILTPEKPAKIIRYEINRVFL
ncbi:MAG: GNAT family N-acetyltransferase [Candidatus Cloacimonetes bacterium]|nr:GNAT family N-acetyltransferase [Candidatus Cloacimonadota bacterium]